MKYNICDYSGFNYKGLFWQNQNREYEDYVERQALKKLTGQLSGACLEIGSGYGRLLDVYAGSFQEVIMLDYAADLLAQAEARIKELNLNHVSCRQGNLYELTKLQRKFDCAVSVRVIHHVEDVPAFFSQVNCILKKDGVFILEFANKRNILEIMRFFLGKPNLKPFNQSPSRRGDNVYYNFHPGYIKKMLQQHGFAIEEVICVSLFRNSSLKNIFNYVFLAKIENQLAKVLGFFKLSPSIIVKAQKRYELTA